MSTGKVIGGRYRLGHQLGQGGMGSVWRAEHLELGHPVAIKLVDPELARTPEALARFKTEARAAASLRGTHVVQLLDYGVDGETPFIAMELLEGETLQARLERKGRLSAREVVQILDQVGKAIERAHTQGIVHRDLKPENIFLAREGAEEVAKVLDFGIAKTVTGGAAQPSDQTKTGSLLGTPYYMSPEQASGRKAIDHRTDVWALGIIAYECLTGQLPFADDTIGGLVLSICTEEAPPASGHEEIPSTFDDWYRRSTAKDPRDRFPSVREQMAALREALVGEERHSPREPLAPTSRSGARPDRDGSQTLPPTLPSRAAPQRRKRALSRAIGVLAVLALASSVFLLLQDRSADPGDPSPATPPPSPASSRQTEAPDTKVTVPPTGTLRRDARSDASSSPEPGGNQVQGDQRPTGKEPSSPGSGRSGQPTRPSPAPTPHQRAPDQAPVLVPKGITVP